MTCSKYSTGPKDDEEAGASVIQKEAEKAVTVQSREEKA